MAAGARPAHIFSIQPACRVERPEYQHLWKPKLLLLLRTIHDLLPACAAVYPFDIVGAGHSLLVHRFQVSAPTGSSDVQMHSMPYASTATITHGSWETHPQLSRI